MTWTDDDQHMAELRNWLVEQGFVVLSDRYDPEHFGDQIVQLARPIGIQLVRDRDQWGIYLSGPDGNWLPLEHWLDPAGSPRDSLSAADQSQLLRARLADIEHRASASGEPSTTE